MNKCPLGKPSLLALTFRLKKEKEKNVIKRSAISTGKLCRF